MRSLSVRVNEHAISGSSLGVLQGALLREVRRQSRRLDRSLAGGGRVVVPAERELDIAIELARRVGCARADVEEAMA